MRAKMLLAGGALAIMAMGGLGASYGHPQNGSDCNGTGHRHTAAGSCKDTDNHQISCGDKGALPAHPAGINVSANQTANGGEVEACSDEGSGNQHGRLLLEVNTAEQGARLILDSDPDQPFPAGWITAQASAKSGNKTGLYCSRDQGEPGIVEGDGYAQSWSNPGPDEGADCTPNPPSTR